MLTVRPFSLLVLCLLSTSIWAETPAAEKAGDGPKHLLRYQFRAGETLHYRLSEKSSFHTVAPREESTARNDSSIEKHYRVVEVLEDGSARLHLVFDRINIQYDFPQRGVVKYDTSSDAEPPGELASLKRKIGKPAAEALVSANGELKAIDRLVDDGSTQSSLDASREKQNFLVVLPKEPIAIGESWKFGYTIDVQLTANVTKEFELRYVYTLDRVEDGVAEISFTTFTMPLLRDPLLRGKFLQYLPRGTVRFDMNEGRLISQTQTVEGTEVNVGGPRTALTVELHRQENLVSPNVEQKLSQTER